VTRPDRCLLSEPKDWTLLAAPWPISDRRDGNPADLTDSATIFASRRGTVLARRCRRKDQRSTGVGSLAGSCPRRGLRSDDPEDPDELYRVADGKTLEYPAGRSRRHGPVSRAAAVDRWSRPPGAKAQICGKPKQAGGWISGPRKDRSVICSVCIPVGTLHRRHHRAADNAPV